VTSLVYLSGSIILPLSDVIMLSTIVLCQQMTHNDGQVLPKSVCELLPRSIMRVLIADKLSKSTEEALKELGLTVETQPDLTADSLPDAIGDAHVLVVRSTKVTAATIDAASQLSLIVRAGAGVNTIDVDEASRCGIYVTNCPGKNSAAVAELAIGLLIACDRQIVAASNDLRNGRWRKKEYGKARGLRGRTLGVLGVGMIGREVICRAKGLGMHVIAWSRSLDENRAGELGVEFAATPLEVARASDAISLHVAATNETRHLVDAEFLAAMKDGAILINAARGEIVDQAALVAAIKQKGLRVGLDVFAEEPKQGEAPFADTELAGLVTATPHIGASTDEASEAIAAEVVRIVQLYRETGKPANTVNMCGKSPATHSLVVRHFNRVGVLASVLELLREEGINVEEMENTIFDGAQAACCTFQLDTSPSESILERLRTNEAILQVSLESLGTS
jgi:D-3-phosphoglycerate dehydrogenase